jgi:serine/threonine protein kinase
MNCQNPACSAVLPAGAAFCPKCGKEAPGPDRQQARQGAGAPTISGLSTIVPESLLDRRAALALEPGSLFADRYLVQRHIGTGGMGVVYVAKDRNTGEDIALKLLHPDLVEGAEAMQRLVAEGVTARKIRHPNVVAVYDIGQVDGQPFLAMEYVGGGTLRGWIGRAIQAGREVPVATAVGITKSILAGLAEAHRMGVIHRDLKPENVLLAGDPFQGDFRLKVLDFGIARAVSGGGVATPGSSAGTVGTLLYMAPEQRTAAQTAGPAADLYSVTAMLFELLLETPPQGSFEPPSRMRGDVPTALDAVIERGLKLRARDRFPSAEEYSAALDQAMAAPRPEPKKAAPPPDPVPRTTELPPPFNYLPSNSGAVLAYKWWKQRAAQPAQPWSMPPPVQPQPVQPFRKKRSWRRWALIVFAFFMVLGAIGKMQEDHDRYRNRFPMNAAPAGWKSG